MIMHDRPFGETSLENENDDKDDDDEKRAHVTESYHVRILRTSIPIGECAIVLRQPKIPANRVPIVTYIARSSFPSFYEVFSLFHIL